MKLLLSAERLGFKTHHFKMFRDVLSQIKLNPTSQVWLFGSRALGTHRKYSDVDLLLVDIDREQISKLTTLLEDSDLPFKFDLVSNSDLESSYRDDIESQKVLLMTAR